MTEFTLNYQYIDTMQIDMRKIQFTHLFSTYQEKKMKEIFAYNIVCQLQQRHKNLTSVDRGTTVHIPKKPHTHNVVVIVRKNCMSLSRGLNVLCKYI